MPLDHAFVGSVAVVYAAFGTSLNLVATGHVYPVWGESWAIEYIVLFIFFFCLYIYLFQFSFFVGFYKVHAVILYLSANQDGRMYFSL